MKYWVTLLLVIITATSVEATLVVYDPILHGTTVVDQIVNFAKWVETEIHSAATELNTLNEYESTLLQIARAGDPAQLRSLPGIQNIATLEAIYAQVEKDYTDINAVANPANFQANFNSILSTYEQPQWNGFTAANGTKIAPDMGHFQFSTSSYQAVAVAQQQMISLDNQKKLLQQQRDTANASLQSATTTAQVDKFHAVINSINGALADVNQSLQQLFNHQTMQQTQTANAQKIYQASQVEAQAAAAYQAIDTDMTQLPSAGFRQLALWQN